MTVWGCQGRLYMHSVDPVEGVVMYMYVWYVCMYIPRGCVMLLVSTKNFTLCTVSNQKSVVVLMFISDWLIG